MTTRLDLAIQKHPDHEESIRLFAQRDPSGNLKYLHWQVKVLAAGQALAPEIADVADLFHKFAGQWIEGTRRQDRIHPDINTYRPQDLAGLRTRLLKMKRSQDKKRRKRERLYKIEGEVEAEIVYESPDLIVRHIKNKQASVHYGLSTKWCIAMKRELYFEDYDAQNATFFFFERKVRRGDEFDKSCVMVGRMSGTDVDGMSCFTSLDERVGPFRMVKAYGMHVFEILRTIYERSEAYPGSATACVLAGTATEEQIAKTIEALHDKKAHVDVDRIVEAICCNDTAPWALLEPLSLEAEKLSKSGWTRWSRDVYQRRRRRPRALDRRTKELMRTVVAALSVHPNVPEQTRDTFTKQLRRWHINPASVCRTHRRDGVAVSFHRRGESSFRGLGRRYHLRTQSVSALTRRVGAWERALKRAKKRLRKAKQKAAKAKRRRPR